MEIEFFVAVRSIVNGLEHPAVTLHGFRNRVVGRVVLTRGDLQTAGNAVLGIRQVLIDHVQRGQSHHG